jgi:cytidine deaminase
MSEQKTRTRKKGAQSTPQTPTDSGEPAGNDPADASNPDPEVIINVLIEMAKNARKRAYAPYSRYRVGAALLSVRGEVYTGCNVENAAYGQSICAERGAVMKAVSEGERKFDVIAIVTEDGGSPCGACRQFLSEFGDDIMVILADRRGHYTLTSIGELLPMAFDLRT